MFNEKMILYASDVFISLAINVFNWFNHNRGTITAGSQWAQIPLDYVFDGFVVY